MPSLEIPREQCSLLTSVFIVLAAEMVLREGYNSLDFKWTKLLRYEHHKLNYETSLRDQIVPDGLKIYKKPCFVPVTLDFDKKWQDILHTAEISLIQLLSEESTNVIMKL